MVERFSIHEVFAPYLDSSVRLLAFLFSSPFLFPSLLATSDLINMKTRGQGERKPSRIDHITDYKGLKEELVEGGFSSPFREVRAK